MVRACITWPWMPNVCPHSFRPPDFLSLMGPKAKYSDADVRLLIELRKRGFSTVEIREEHTTWDMRWMQRTYKAYLDTGRSPADTPKKKGGRPQSTSPQEKRRLVRYAPAG